jgi:hypothetical protein
MFSSDDLSTRLIGMFQFNDWNTVKGLVSDTMVNVLAFLPIGFAGSALCHLISRRRQFAPRTFVIVAGLSLVISFAAEAIQLCIPMRTASMRDVLTLEVGGILGACAWRAIAEDAIEFIFRWFSHLARWGGGRIFRYRWSGLFALLFVACLALNSYASPTELFVVYCRHFSVTDARMSVVYASLFDTARPSHSVWTAFVPSLVSSVGLVAACRAADVACPR